MANGETGKTRGGRKRERMEEIFETVTTENFIQTNVQYQITDQGRSENTEKNKSQNYT